MQGADGAVGGELEMLESPMRPSGRLGSRCRQRVLEEALERVEIRLEMGLADQRGVIARFMQGGCHRRSVHRERHAVHPHPVGGRVLTRNDGGTRGHAHHRLRLGALEANAGGGQGVDDIGARQRSAVTPEGVVALLIGGHQQDLAAHWSGPPFKDVADVLERVAGRTAEDERHGGRIGID